MFKFDLSQLFQEFPVLGSLICQNIDFSEWQTVNTAVNILKMVT